jgi:hypothetical protein
VFFGILFDMADRNSNNTNLNFLLYALLFIYSLLVILYGIVIYDGLSSGLNKLNNVSSVIELLQKGTLIIIAFIMFDIIYMMGNFLFSSYFLQFEFVFYAVVELIVIFIVSLLLIYYSDKIKTLRIAILGAIFSFILTIFFLSIVIDLGTYGIALAKLGKNFVNSPDITISNTMGLVISIAFLSLFFVNFGTLFIKSVKIYKFQKTNINAYVFTREID